MLVYAELEPSRSGSVIMRRLNAIIKLYGRVDIPDVPLGKPSISSPVLAAYSKAMGADVIAHIRVSDHNTVSFKSIVKSLAYMGVDKQLYLRGDPPQQGGLCGEWTPELAVRYALTHSVKPGLLISPRKRDPEIAERLRSGASFYVITRYSIETRRRTESVVGLIRSISPGSEVGVYLVLGTPRNVEYLRENSIPYTPSDMVEESLNILEHMGVDFVVISSPGDGDFVISKSIAETVLSFSRG